MALAFFVVIDKFALLEQWPAEPPKAENVKNDMQRSLLKLSNPQRPVCIVLICSIQRATVNGMAGSFRSNFEGVFGFRVHNKRQAGDLFGLTEEFATDVRNRVAEFVCTATRSAERRAFETIGGKEHILPRQCQRPSAGSSGCTRQPCKANQESAIVGITGRWPITK